jgi:hypothetical protein
MLEAEAVVEGEVPEPPGATAPVGTVAWVGNQEQRPMAIGSSPTTALAGFGARG